MWRAVFLIVTLTAGGAFAQDRQQTLADIRQELTVLFVEVQKLKRELSTTGAPQTNLGGTSALDRLNTMEAELQRLTASTEELTNRVNRIVEDGTNRIGDLEFRLVKLEGGDISQLGETTTLGGDVGDSHSWQAGVSYLSGKAQGRLTDEDDTGFTGDVSLAVFDLVWKWAPQGNRTRTNLVIQAEYLQREEDGIYTLTTPAATGSVDTKQSGWYVQTVYQFMPRWRIGLRHDALDIDDPGSVFAGTVLDPSGHKPERNSVMLDYAHSEFSRIRVQYTDDDSGPEPDHQLFVQYVMSLGAHGAHQF